MNHRYLNTIAKKSAMIIIVVAFFVLAALIAVASTKLVYNPVPFRVPVGTTVNSANIDVSNHNQIRVCVYNLQGSPSPVTVRFILMQGNTVVGELEPLTVAPNSSPTKLFAAPGVALRLMITSAPAPRSPNGSNTLTVAIYGSD